MVCARRHALFRPRAARSSHESGSSKGCSRASLAGASFPWTSDRMGRWGAQGSPRRFRQSSTGRWSFRGFAALAPLVWIRFAPAQHRGSGRQDEGLCSRGPPLAPGWTPFVSPFRGRLLVVAGRVRALCSDACLLLRGRRGRPVSGDTPVRATAALCHARFCCLVAAESGPTGERHRQSQRRCEARERATGVADPGWGGRRRRNMVSKREWRDLTINVGCIRKDRGGLGDKRPRCSSPSSTAWRRECWQAHRSSERRRDGLDFGPQRI